MASSRKSNLTDIVAARLAPLVPRHSHILVGLSGGMDSVVLLHLLHALAPRFDWRLSALHVHHGISPNADDWAEFCASVCAHQEIPLHIERVSIAPLRDAHGIEAAARKLRHAALAGIPCDYVALAHHADDQVETMLLQLLRGAGVRGAAAMPVLSNVEGPVLSNVEGPVLNRVTSAFHALVRPFLDVPRAVLQDYAQQHGLTWVEDESNADDSYPRNFLRQRLLPLLETRFPAYRDTLTRGAQHFAEASELLDEMAKIDACDAIRDGTLALSCLRSLPRARARNVLRHFLHRCNALMPSGIRLDEMLRQLLEAREDAAVCIALGDRQVRRYQGRAHVVIAMGEFDRKQVLRWLGEARLQWPAMNRAIVFSRRRGQGISLEKLQRAPVTLRLRSGGESLRVHSGSGARTLKNLLQERHVPPWQRERMPLLYSGNELVAIAGMAIAADYRAQQEEEGVMVSFE